MIYRIWHLRCFNNIDFFFYDNETCLFLAAPIYFREDYEHWKAPYEVYFLCGKSKPLGKKMSLHWLLTVCCPNWTSITQKKVTLKHCQGKEGQPYRTSCFTEKSIKFARPIGQRWMPHVAEELWVTAQAASRFCHFSHILEAVLLALPAYSVIIFFLGLWGSWRLDNYSSPDAESKLW